MIQDTFWKWNPWAGVWCAFPPSRFEIEHDLMGEVIFFCSLMLSPSYHFFIARWNDLVFVEQISCPLKEKKANNHQPRLESYPRGEPLEAGNKHRVVHNRAVQPRSVSVEWIPLMGGGDGPKMPQDVPREKQHTVRYYTTFWLNMVEPHIQHN